MPVATAKELRAKTLDPLFRDPAVDRALNMMNLDPYLTQDNILLWIEAVGEIESSGGKNTSNRERVGPEGSTAKGNYQFTDPTYRSYLQSYKNALTDADKEFPPWADSELDAGDNRDPRNLTDLQQRILLVVGTHARAKDADMQKAWGEGDLLGAGKKIFYVTHYAGKPDKTTVRVVNEEFDRIKDNVVTIRPNSEPVGSEPRLESELASAQMEAMQPRVPAEVTVPERAGRFPDIKIPDRAKKIVLEAVETPERSGRFAEIKVPDRAKKILLEEVEVPAPYTNYESVLPDLDPSMYRKDGSRKSSSGYLGPQKNKETGQTMTEYTIGVQIDGKEVEIPSMVPGLTDKEVDAIRSGEVLDSVAVKAKAHAEQRIAKGQSPFYQDLEEYTDYESVTDQRLAEVTTPDRQLAEKLEPKGITIPQSALDAINPPAKERKTDDIVIPQSAIDIRRELAHEEGKRIASLVTEAGEGATLGLLGELKAVIESASSDKTYERAKAEYEVAREQFRANNPELGQLATPVELIATLPTGYGIARGLAKAGVTSIAAQAGVESSIYGVATGEGTENRLFQGIGYGALGVLTGKAFDKILDPSFAGRFNTIEEFNKARAELQEEIVVAAKMFRAPEDITNAELATQLLMREIEFLGDAVGRQGTLPKNLVPFYQRMKGYAEDMGVDIRQLNKVVRSDRTIKDLRKTLDEPFETLDDMVMLRQDLLDRTTGRLISDVGRTIPEAQEFIVRFRRLASPLATLAEETVGVSFSQRLVRAMNRVTRKQVDLDNMWKGMEPFRELASSNPKFNDLLLDAVNPRLSSEFKEKALLGAMNVARAKIGKGAPERLQKFFDDNIEFSKRYRKQVTAGEVTPVWMHSSPESVLTDASLRTYRDRAAAKAEDAASKNVQRPSMKEWREKNAKRPLQKQQEYANIFDSHWTWQRQTLTRMEIGEQLGFRTAGKPLVVGKNLDKKALKEGATELEATASYEAGKFRLFDDNIIAEALKREGYSDVQIKNAQQIIDDIGINANKGMASELDIIRSLGYVGTIANPYGALMNVHDLFNASFELGLGNVIKAVFAKGSVEFKPADMGLARQVFGEFVRKARKGTQKDIDALGGYTSGNKFIEGAAKVSEDLLEWSMKWSGFAKLDQFGKSRIMGASFNKAKQDIANGSFDTKWQYSFSKTELQQLKKDIADGVTDSELVRDLVMFDLFKLQPINAAAQTAAGLANPNARIFYMLKGFAIKQFDLMERRIWKEWEAGNKKQALENLAKYVVLSGGGYGVVNEARQVLKGEAPDPAEGAASALYQIGSVVTFGAMGANDYGYDKFMNDPLDAMAKNMLPPIGATLPGAVLEDMADAFRKGDPLPDETIYALPIVGKTLKGFFD
tara:strand:- start:93 stop:4214 length:4122 start_codon:yes stop_codon:yes gene_type:complete